MQWHALRFACCEVRVSLMGSCAGRLSKGEQPFDILSLDIVDVKKQNVKVNLPNVSQQRPLEGSQPNQEPVNRVVGNVQLQVIQTLATFQDGLQIQQVVAIFEPRIFEEVRIVTGDGAQRYAGAMKLAQSQGLLLHGKNRQDATGPQLETRRKENYQAFGSVGNFPGQGRTLETVLDRRPLHQGIDRARHQLRSGCCIQSEVKEIPGRLPIVN
jgi:hypothetical protein